MVIPRDARPTGKTVHFKYVGAIFVFICLIVAVGYTPDASAAAPLGKTLGGLANNTVPAVTNTVTGTTAPITNAVSPALTNTVNNVAAPVTNTAVPTAVGTVENVTTPVVSTVGVVAGPAVPAVVSTVDTVGAPVTNIVAPAIVNTVGAVSTPVTNTVAAVAAPVTAPVARAIAPIANPLTAVVTSLVPVPAALRTTMMPIAATGRPLAFMPLFTASLMHTASQNSLPGKSIFSDIAGIFNKIAGFFVGVLPPSSWALGGTDTSRAVALWLVILIVLLGTLTLATSGGIYRKLRQVQRQVYSIRDEVAFETILRPRSAQISAASTTAVLVGIAVMFAIMAGL